jgi:hypothetical protein
LTVYIKNVFQRILVEFLNKLAICSISISSLRCFNLRSAEKDLSAVQDDNGTVKIIFRSQLNSVKIPPSELFDLNTSIASCIGTVYVNFS